jgi:hypothetical protein
VTHATMPMVLGGIVDAVKEEQREVQRRMSQKEDEAFN